MYTHFNSNSSSADYKLVLKFVRWLKVFCYEKIVKVVYLFLLKFTLFIISSAYGVMRFLIILL